MTAKRADTKLSQSLPTSLTGHVVPDERMELIGSHMATLAQMALRVADMLPLSADVGDFAATLHADARRREGV
jgi:hypothetical protein